VLFDRLGDIFKMEEFKKERNENVNFHEAGVTAIDAAFSWGYRVKQDQSENKGFKVEVE